MGVFLSVRDDLRDARAAGGRAEAVRGGRAQARRVVVCEEQGHQELVLQDTGPAEGDGQGVEHSRVEKMGGSVEVID